MSAVNSKFPTEISNPAARLLSKQPPIRWPESMDRPVLVSNPTEPVAEYAAIPDCNLYNREGLLSERKSGRLLPKRHQIKHLEFVVSWFGTRGSGVQILSPRPFFHLCLRSLTLSVRVANGRGNRVGITEMRSFDSPPWCQSNIETEAPFLRSLWIR